MNMKKFLTRKTAIALCAACLVMPVGTEAAQSDIDTFKSAYFTIGQQSQDMHVTLNLVGPSFSADTELLGQVNKDNTMQFGGKISWGFTDLSTNKTKLEDIPVYVEQDDKDIDLYGKRGGSWYYEQFTGLPLWLVSAVKSNDMKVLTNNAAAVKYVEILKDDGTQQAMELSLSGQELARLAREYSQQAGDGSIFTEYLAQGLEHTNPVCTWVIDKKTKKTVTLQMDLTDVMQKYAQSVLDASYKSQVDLTAENAKLLKTIGYYSNLKIYLSSTSGGSGEMEQAKNLAWDSGDAKPVGSLLADLERDAVSSIK